jgi:large subunit ribosomal protein L9
MDIAKAVNEAGVELAKKEVILPNGAFRVAGEYEVDLHLHADVNAALKLSIIPEA